MTAGIFGCLGSNGFFVMAGYDNGIDKSTVSSNGGSGNWQTAATVVNPGGSIGAFCMDYGNNKFIASWDDSELRSSTDGLNWTNLLNFSGNIFGLKYANNLWVAVGGTPIDLPQIYTSIDNITWTSRTVTVSGSETIKRITGITYGLSLWVAITYNGHILTSSDAITWTDLGQPTSSPRFTSIDFDSVGLRFCVTSPTGIWSSTDGTNWTQVLATSDNLSLIRHAGGLWVATNTPGGLSAVIWTSANGTSWTKVYTGSDNITDMTGLDNLANIWLAGGYSQSSPVGGVLYGSTDSGATWSTISNQPFKSVLTMQKRIGAIRSNRRAT